MRVLAQGHPLQSRRDKADPAPVAPPSTMHRPWSHSGQVGGRQAGSRAGEDSTFPGARVSSTPFPLGVVTWPLLGSGKCRERRGHVL